MRRYFLMPLLAASLLISPACSKDEPDNPEIPADGVGVMGKDIDMPDFDANIPDWDGTKANDAAADSPGTDNSIYHEANSFTKSITLTYSNSGATLSSQPSGITVKQNGAHVTLNINTSGVEINVEGSCDDGSLKIYGGYPVKLVLNDLTLTSKHSPAINSQNKKRTFVVLKGETHLADAATYTDIPATEDAKGCFFAEGNLIVSGDGVLRISAAYKHGLATDDCLTIRPGATLVVETTAANAVQVKGDDTKPLAFNMLGGMLYARSDAPAGKALKCDQGISINGGTLQLYTTGNATYDKTANDTSSSACIKTDKDLTINAGTLTLKSSGLGGKGINVSGSIEFNGGNTEVITSGGRFEQSESLTSSPKGIKADSDITINNGSITVAVLGEAKGGEGIEAGKNLTIDGGSVNVYAYDNALNTSGDFTLNDGTVLACSAANDGVDSNGSLTINGGTITAYGASAPECSFDVASREKFKINGGTVLGFSGALEFAPEGKHMSLLVKNITADKGQKIEIRDLKDATVFQTTALRSMSNAVMFFSSKSLKIEGYNLYVNGKYIETFIPGTYINITL